MKDKGNKIVITIDTIITRIYILKQKGKELVRFFANIKTMWEKCPAF